MPPALVLEHAIRTPAIYLDRDTTVAAIIIFIFMNERDTPLFPAGIFPIHLEKHFGKVFGIFSAGAGNYCKDSTTFIIFPQTLFSIFQFCYFLDHTLSFVFIIPKIRLSHLSF